MYRYVTRIGILLVSAYVINLESGCVCVTVFTTFRNVFSVSYTELIPPYPIRSFVFCAWLLEATGWFAVNADY